MISNKNMPCKDCPQDVKYLGCHDHCEKYLAIKAENEKIRKKISTERELSGMCYRRKNNGVSMRRKLKGEH